MRSSPAIAFFISAVLLLSGCSANQQDSDVGIQLFMFNWNSVARECKETLGPQGISWVLISPAQEHITGDPWWVQYQPVSYQIESRLGSREEFAQMVRTCEQSGVSVIADAVINHMSASSGIGWAGTQFEKYDYPGLYEESDFHNCGLTDDNQIASYSNKAQVQTCELLGLSDLATEKDKVQSTIVLYLLDLLSLGVKGFRIDAAKHIDAKDLKGIVSQLPAGTNIYSEVIKGYGEPIQPAEYTEFGKVWDFGFSSLATSFDKRRVPNMARAINSGEIEESQSAISFVSNHDTERNGRSLSPSDNPEAFELATLFMLAVDFGTPMLYSGYQFDDYDAPPPLDEGGKVKDANCSIGWFCQQNSKAIGTMIGWRSATKGLETTNYSYHSSYASFGRGDRGFFAINAGAKAITKIFQSSLPQGTYCNLLEKPGVKNDCPGSEIVVDGSGKLNLTIPSQSAVAILR
ncbi:MAG: alpha-amylase family glycosyl hydrolase [Actinomycetota bacterium]